MEIQTMDRPQMTEGPVNKNLIKLAIPMMLWILAFLLFNVVDTFFISQFS